MSASRRLDGPESPCPVCCWPDYGLASCGQCGTELRPGLAADVTVPGGDQIGAACLRYDLLAAMRAASWTGERDYELLARLSRLVRGGPPLAHELEQAEVEFDAWTGQPRGASALGLGFTLSRLVAGEIDAIEFVEIAPDAVSMQTLVTNELCVPVCSGTGASYPWPGLVPLPADDDLRMLRLAGGVGGSEADDPAALAVAAERAIRQVVRLRLQDAMAAIRAARPAGGLDGAPGWIRARLDTVLVCRTAGWPLLEAAATVARSVLLPVAELTGRGAGTLADDVDAAARRAPLRYGYDLMLAKVDRRTGEVKADPWPLFQPGTVIRRHDRPTESAYVMTPPAAADRLALPVVMRRGPDAASWPAVGIATMPGSTPGTTQLQVRLHAPGQVSFHARPDVVSDDAAAGSWPELLAQLPGSVPGEMAIDLILLVELAGEPGVVARRVAMAADVVSRLDGAGTNIAIAGYRDHFHSYVPNAVAGRNRLVVGCRLGPPDGARSLLARRDLWQAAEIGDDYAAPLEDALHWIEHEGCAWRRDARHLLVVLGNRPPHPGDVNDHANPKAAVCPYHHTWRDILGRLRRDHVVTCFAVRPATEDLSLAHGDAEHAWQEFCAEGYFSALDAVSSADELLTAIGLTGGDNGLRLPLAVRGGRSSSHYGRAGNA
jgi:hypothetical protein